MLEPQILSSFFELTKHYNKMSKFWNNNLECKFKGNSLNEKEFQKFSKNQLAVSNIMRSLRLNSYRVEELIDELYGKNKRLSFLEGSLIRLAEKNKIKKDKFLKLYTGHEIEKSLIRKMSFSKDKGSTPAVFARIIASETAPIVIPTIA